MVDVPDETWKRIEALGRLDPFLGAPPMRTIADRLEWGIKNLTKERDELRQQVTALHEERGTVWTADLTTIGFGARYE
jgi:hypothetical protein